MATVRAWLSGFLLLGSLLGLLGSLIIIWQYQIDVEPNSIGLHFLSLNCGYVLAAAISQRVLRRIPIRTVALVACTVAFASLIGLTLAAPPAPMAARLLLLAALGLSAGSLGTSLLYASESYFAQDPWRATNKAGIFFGCGCLLATAVTGASYFSGFAQIATAALAAVPAVYFWLYARISGPAGLALPRLSEHDILRERLRDLRKIALVLLSLLLFLQFGTEWAVAGWLPLFLIHRLGSNPALAIGVLSIYFLALMVGRILAQRLLPRAHPRRLLIGSVALSLAGFLLLSFTGSLLAATAAVIVIGAGFAPVFPVVAERLDQRFSFHPGFYSGTISIAVTGALTAPWLLGFVNAIFGMQFVMLLPAVGSLLVLLVSLLLMFEAHLMDDKRVDEKPVQVRSAKAGS